MADGQTFPHPPQFIVSLLVFVANGDSRNIHGGNGVTSTETTPFAVLTHTRVPAVAPEQEKEHRPSANRAVHPCGGRHTAVASAPASPPLDSAPHPRRVSVTARLKNFFMG